MNLNFLILLQDIFLINQYALYQCIFTKFKTNTIKTITFSCGFIFQTKCLYPKSEIDIAVKINENFEQSFDNQYIVYYHQNMQNNTAQEIMEKRKAHISELKRQIKLNINNCVPSYGSEPTTCSEDQKIIKKKDRKNSLHIDTQDLFKAKYVQQQKLGQGTSGVVYRCQHIQSKQHYALKIQKFETQNLLHLKESFGDISELNHPNIIKYKALYISTQTNKAYLVMEDFNYPSLSEYQIKDELEVKIVAQKLLSALNYLHEHGICHRDIKPDNILYNPMTKEIKLIDFNVSKRVKKRKLSNQMMTPTGTTQYRAPETFQGKIYTQKIDEWAVGITLYKIISKVQLFEFQTTEQMTIKFSKQTYNYTQSLFTEKIWKKYSSQSKDLISKLLGPENMRIKASQALRHPWLTMNVNKGRSSKDLCLRSSKNIQISDIFLMGSKQEDQNDTPNYQHFSWDIIPQQDEPVKRVSRKLMKDNLLFKSTETYSDGSSIHYDSDDDQCKQVSSLTILDNSTTNDKSSLSLIVTGNSDIKEQKKQQLLKDIRSSY